MPRMRTVRSHAAIDENKIASDLSRTPELGMTSYSRVRDAIRDDILSGVFAQGEWLKLSLLVERYGLSPAPIREALNQLEVEGLIDLLPNRGARVRSITRAFIADLFEIRLALEPLLAERSAAAATEEDVKNLEEAQLTFELAIKSKNLTRIIEGNRIFHRTLQAIRLNKPAIDLLRQHSALVSSVRRQFGFPPQRYATIIKEHRRIIEACRSRNGSQAFSVMRSHVQHSMDELLPRIPES
jgi:DNA-binding GntR family transcriptional regulator